MTEHEAAVIVAAKLLGELYVGQRVKLLWPYDDTATIRKILHYGVVEVLLDHRTIPVQVSRSEIVPL